MYHGVAPPPFFGEHVKNWNENNEIRSGFTTSVPLPQVFEDFGKWVLFFFWLVKIFCMSLPPFKNYVTETTSMLCKRKNHIFIDTVHLFIPVLHCIFSS